MLHKDLNPDTYEYRGYILKCGDNWTATKNGRFVAVASSDKELESIIDTLITS